MTLRPWYNKDANYQTNAKSFMDYLARTNKFLEVLIEDYEIFQELVIEELERIKFDSEMAVDDILLNWLEDGTLARIINDGVLGNKADKSFVNVELEKVATQLTKKTDKTYVDSEVERLDNMNSVINQEINNLEENMNNTFNHYDGLKDQKYIDVKNNNYFNAIGDGEFHTIAEIFPEVTLSEVQVLNHEATLQSSADWFVIQSLMDEGLKQGKEVFISTGNYIIDHPLLFERYTRISGQGKTSMLHSRVVNDFVLRHRDIQLNDGRADYISIKSFYINGTDHIGSGGGIHFRHGGHMSVIQDMWIKYFRGTAQVSLKLTRTWYLYIQNCDLSNSNNGIILGEEEDYRSHVVNNVVIRDCKIFGILQYNPKTYGSVGVRVNGGVNNVITGCQIEGWETGILQGEHATGTVYSDSYSEDIIYRHVSDYGNGFRVLNLSFIHIASNAGTTMLHLSDRSNGGTFEHLIFRNIGNVNYLFDDKVSKNTTFKNLQAAHSETYLNGISTEDIYNTIPPNVTGIGYKQDELSTGIAHLNKTIAFDRGISLPQVLTNPTIKNSLYVNPSGELTFYDGTTHKKVSLVED